MRCQQTGAHEACIDRHVTPKKAMGQATWHGRAPVYKSKAKKESDEPVERILARLNGVYEQLSGPVPVAV
jgi:hypothetical protein